MIEKFGHLTHINIVRILIKLRQAPIESSERDLSIGTDFIKILYIIPNEYETPCNFYRPKKCDRENQEKSVTPRKKYVTFFEKSATKMSRKKGHKKIVFPR